jgi:hypothetical protein
MHHPQLTYEFLCVFCHPRYHLKCKISFQDVAELLTFAALSLCSSFKPITFSPSLVLVQTGIPSSSEQSDTLSAAFSEVMSGTAAMRMVSPKAASSTLTQRFCFA